MKKSKKKKREKLILDKKIKLYKNNDISQMLFIVLYEVTCVMIKVGNSDPVRASKGL